MKKILMEASQISDFQAGTDKVIRRGTRCFIVARDGATSQYKELEVRSDVLTDQHRANFTTLDPGTKNTNVRCHQAQSISFRRGTRGKISAIPRSAILRLLQLALFTSLLILLAAMSLKLLILWSVQ